MGIVQERAIAAVKRHGGVGAAARALRINRSVLSLLADGKRRSASRRTLAALGLRAQRHIEIFDAQLGNGRDGAS